MISPEVFFAVGSAVGVAFGVDVGFGDAAGFDEAAGLDDLAPSGIGGAYPVLATSSGATALSPNGVVP